MRCIVENYLDSTIATQIPKSAQGRFMIDDITQFQAYYFKKEGDKRKIDKHCSISKSLHDMVYVGVNL